MLCQGILDACQDDTRPYTLTHSHTHTLASLQQPQQETMSHLHPHTHNCKQLPNNHKKQPITPHTHACA